MIKYFESISLAISQHEFAQDSGSMAFIDKVDKLENAINTSIHEIGMEILKEQYEIHVALSGGMDSSTMLITMLYHGFPVIAHTIAGYEDHPDMYYAKLLTKKLDVEHKTYVIRPTSKSLKTSKYMILFDAVKNLTKTLVCGDCIDEQLGGYYPHQNPVKLPIYDSTKTMEENRLNALEYFMGRLMKDHLIIQNRCSNQCGIDIYLPYGNPNIFHASSLFSLNELLDDNNRKKPMLDIALKKGVPVELIERRKLGLVQAMDDFTKQKAL
jgi:asparagine synthetase B (glutamine-hydrolysing)